MKRKITFFICMIFAAIIYGQGIIISDEVLFADFEGDPENFGYTVVSARGHSEHGLVDNPGKSDLNNTDKVYWGIRDEGNWNADVTIEWEDPVLTEGRNFMSIMVYSEGYNAFVYLKIFHEGSVIREGWASEGTPAESDGQWAQAVLSIGAISQFDKMEIYLSNNWGGNQANAVGYFDQLGMYKESYEYQGPFLDIVYEAIQTEEEMDIDGLDLEDIWLDAHMEQFVRTDEKAVLGTWSSVWDYENLYFFFDINVDYVHTWQDSNWAEWRGDGFQVYMDILARRVDDRVFGNMNGVAVCPDLESSGAQDAGRGFRNYLPFGENYRPLAAQGSLITGTGYTVELAWPWKGLAHAAGAEITDVEQWVDENVKPGLELAIAIQLNIADATGARTEVINWLPQGGWNNSGNWAALVLTGADASAITDVQNNNILKLYPTTANDVINIELSGLRQITIFDITGRKLKTITSESHKTSVNISQLPGGVYIVQASDGLQTHKMKFIKM